MKSTNMGILKPALWHTPAITKDGIIRQAPDPRENHEGFTSRSLVANRASRQGPHLHGSNAHRPALFITDLHDVLGVRRRSGWGYLQCAEGFHQRVYEVQYLRCASVRCSVSSHRTQAFASLTRTHHNSVLKSESLRG